jgi:hypothetical protein
MRAVDMIEPCETCLGGMVVVTAEQCIGKVGHQTAVQLSVSVGDHIGAKFGHQTAVQLLMASVHGQFRATACQC